MDVIIYTCSDYGWNMSVKWAPDNTHLPTPSRRLYMLASAKLSSKVSKFPHETNWVETSLVQMENFIPMKFSS